MPTPVEQETLTTSNATRQLQQSSQRERDTHTPHAPVMHQAQATYPPPPPPPTPAVPSAGCSPSQRIHPSIHRRRSKNESINCMLRTLGTSRTAAAAAAAQTRRLESGRPIEVRLDLKSVQNGNKKKATNGRAQAKKRRIPPHHARPSNSTISLCTTSKGLRAKKVKPTPQTTRTCTRTRERHGTIPQDAHIIEC